MGQVFGYGGERVYMPVVRHHPTMFNYLIYFNRLQMIKSTHVRRNLRISATKPYIETYIGTNMAKSINRLNALQVKQSTSAGWYADGNGLYLQVSKTGTKSWVFRYQISGKERRYGLGSYPTISLVSAREKAGHCRKLRINGIDPVEHKRQKAKEKQHKEAQKLTFKQCATAYIEAHKAGWKNKKHCSQWTNTLTTYAYPIIGDLPVQNVDTALVMNILEPIWYTKTETATRVRSRIENVLSWAKVRQYRTGENPALWRGHLDMLLPKRSRVQKVKHFEAMPYDELPAYFKSLRQENTIAYKALAFLILTATRSSEGRAAVWSEFNFDKKTWIIPPERMKADREHRVPLSDEALTLLKEMKTLRVNDDDNRVFPSLCNSGFITAETVLNQVKRTQNDLTVHGFRSSFRDWCAEMTSFPERLAESALAHKIKDATQAAYERGDKFEKRRKLMDAWASYCTSHMKQSNIMQIKKYA